MIILPKNLKSIFSHKISQNALANFIRTSLQIIVAFVGNYIIVRTASKQDIGLWALVFAFSAFLNLIDLGISQALIRFTANDEKNTHHYFWTTFQFYLFSGFLVSIFMYVFSQIFGHFYFKNIFPKSNLILITILGFYLSLLGSAFTNVLNGKQMMIKSSVIEVAKCFIYYFFILYYLPQLGVLAFAVATFLSNFLSLIISYFIIRSSISLPFVKFNLIIFKKLFSFGIKTFGVALINQLKGAWLPFLVQSLFGLTYVAYTDYLTRIMGYFRQLLLSSVLPLLPAAAALHAKNEKSKLKKLYRLSLPLLFLIGFFACLALVFITPIVINLWLGSDYQPVIIITQILCWAVFFNLLTGPAVYILQAMNRQKPVLIMSFSAMILFFIFTYLGAKIYGFNTLFIGNVVAETIASVYFIFWFSKSEIIDS